MARRVGWWALCGFAIALIWALTFYLLGPSRGGYPHQAAVLGYLARSALLRISAPVALLGRHYAITWYWSAVMNAVLYSIFGLIVEVIRLPFGARASSA